LPNLLNTLLPRWDVDPPILSAEETTRWDDETRSFVHSHELLKEVTPADWADCQDCGRRCDVEYLQGAQGTMRCFTFCADCGLDEVPHDRLRRWEIDTSAMLQALFGDLKLSLDEQVPNCLWKIRTLWADIDHVSPPEALKAISNAKLPEPSIVVNSGNGVHVYWLLQEPVLIDDVGSPPPVLLDWDKKKDGSSQPRKYVVQDKERVYLDQNRHAFKLSPKALRVQHTLAGIAESIGGDHTKDLSRLLRLPGTMNRKDERNGREPIPTELLICEPQRRYPFSSFESFASASTEAKRAAKIASMPLPRPRKLTVTKADKFDQLIASSSIAEPGRRSEADFAVCCYAVQFGIEKEEAWQQVQGVGKFAEQGRRYFDTTWENAEEQVRTGIYQKVEKKNAESQRKSDISYESDKSSSETPSGGHKRSTITVDTTSTPVSDTLRDVTTKLLDAGNCFSRAEQFVVIHDQQVRTILSSPELAGLLNEYVEFYFINDEEGEYKPFPPAYGNTWLNHHSERGRLPRINLFTSNPVFTEDWRLIEPGYDAPSGIYYAGPRIAARSGTEHLDKLLKDFCFKSPADRTNYINRHPHATIHWF